MNENQRGAILKLRPKLIDTLAIDEIIVQLRTEGILTAHRAELLEKVATKRELCLKFLEIILTLNNAWIPFLNALEKVNQHHLRLELESEAYGIPTDQFKHNLVPQLEDYIRNEAEHIRRFWKEYLEVVDLNTIYQPLEIVEIKGLNVQKPFAVEYDILLENSIGRVLVVEGDPWVGKTTWMSKLALDWTNRNEAIRKKFDLLFLIPLRCLKSSSFDGLLSFLSNTFDERDGTKFKYFLKQSTTLLLLDGFDENPSCIEWISKLTVNEGYRSKVMITCRGSHFAQVRDICEMRLMVKGFKDEETINRFFHLQNCENANQLFASYSQLSEMCKVPMIAAILCSICTHDEVWKFIAEDENCSLFRIFENFVKMLINMATKKRPNLLDKTKVAMEATGNLALANVKNNIFTKIGMLISQINHD